MRKFIALVIFLALHFISEAQQAVIDSLKKELSRKDLHDTARVNRMNDLVGKLQYNDPSEAAKTVAQSILLAQQIKYPLGLTIAYRLRGVLYADQVILDSAGMFYDKAWEIAIKEKEKPFVRQTGLLKHNIAVLFHQRQEMDSAVKLYLEAARIYQEIGEEGLLYFPYGNLVAIYSFLKDNKTALRYAIESRKAAHKLNDPSKIAMSVNNEMAARLELKQYDSVYLPLKTNIPVSVTANNKYAEGKSYSLLGQYYADGISAYDSAITVYHKALQLFTEINNQYEIVSTKHNMGYTYKHKKDYNTAIKYLTESYEMAEKLQLDQALYYNLENLVEIEEAKGNISEAYTYLKKFVVVKDSLQARNNRAEVENLEKKYETEKKEATIKLQQSDLRQRKIINYVLAGSAIALLFISLLSYRNYRNKQKLQQQRINELETQQQLTATEAVLKGEEQERTRLAKDLHDGLGGMLSSVKYSLNTMKGNLIMTPDNAQAFERSIDMLDSSIKEMRRVAHNMMPEALVKFGLDTALKDFCNDVNQSGVLKVHYESIGMKEAVIDQTTAITIYRIVQELLNNTLKHAAAKNAIVQLSKSDNNISITVEDDGKGFDTIALQSVQGIGWSNIKNRVEFLKGSLDVHSRKDEGTSVLIELPF